MNIDLYLEMLLRLVAAVFCGGAIGFERAEHGRDAGIRTHIMVCIGAATVMILSEYLSLEYGNSADIMRMGAQVVSGIGFLGVGCIITNGDRIKGLTTAAGLWTTACLGLVIGSGYYAIAASITVLVLIVMLGLKPLVKRIQTKAKQVTLSVTASSKEISSSLITLLDEMNIALLSIKIKEKEEGYRFILELDSLNQLHTNQLITRFLAVKSVENVAILDE